MQVYFHDDNHNCISEFYDYSWSKYENISKEDVSKGNNTNSTAFPNKFTVNVGVAIKF